MGACSGKIDDTVVVCRNCCNSRAYLDNDDIVDFVKDVDGHYTHVVLYIINNEELVDIDTKNASLWYIGINRFLDVCVEALRDENLKINTHTLKFNNTKIHVDSKKWHIIMDFAQDIMHH